MKKRYQVKPEFFDHDFELGEEGHSFRLRSNALANCKELENLRRDALILNWHWVVIDTRTGQVIKS